MDDYDGGAEGSGPGTDPNPPEREWVTEDEVPPNQMPDDMSPVQPAYDGPSIGPMTAEQDEEGRRQAEEYAEQQQELRRELGQEIPESERHEGSAEPLWEPPVE